MDTKKSIRQRRQERIRLIMNEKQQGTGTQARLDKTPDDFMPPIIARDMKPELEQDPERLWKSQPNPWESAGWRVPPIPSKNNFQTKDGGGGQSGPDLKFIGRGLFIQSAISAALFIILFAMFRLDNPAAKQGQQLVTAALTENMDFESAAEWYKQVFSGAPSFIPSFGKDDNNAAKLAEGEVELPIIAPLAAGSVVRTFAETLSGVEIAGHSEEAVLAAETGRVLLVTDDENTGKTVVIQHADNRVTVYGRLGLVQAAVNDWVEAGQSIGKLSAAGTDAPDGQSLLFFAVKEKGKYVNPADVVPID
ncbi:peptidoglycan DD-metalloendopeptidase family protein [Paenibacillus solisilvae]|uniref:Peptidoglycan DD-metalloendopeptidase family protein n=1 Tax=Paenibacillus solisilvae TaxID=2486751 RepID=A0ABW0VXZ8_9BACL